MSHLSGARDAAVPRPRPESFDELKSAILPLVEEPLARVEEEFRANLASPARIVDEIGSFVAEGGGKRIRPTLHLLAAQMCGYRGPHDVLLGVVLEFIHCATLIHDDIIDGAELRRGRASVNARWDNSVTVLFGDYMFAKAMELALRAESLTVMRKLAAVTLRMTEGEMVQTRYVGRLDLTREQYLTVVEGKTAALFGCCCELAGILADLEPERRQQLARYGTHVGFAFQLVDDLLDLTGDSETLGKPAGNDLAEGKATLAVLDLVSGGSVEGRQLAQKVMNGEAEADAIVRLQELMQQSGSIDRARALARSHAESALASLDGFADGPARDALESLPHLLLDRER